MNELPIVKSVVEYLETPEVADAIGKAFANRDMLAIRVTIVYAEWRENHSETAMINLLKYVFEWQVQQITERE